jgi:hypothetical protein
MNGVRLPQVNLMERVSFCLTDYTTTPQPGLNGRVLNYLRGPFTVELVN